MAGAAEQTPVAPPLPVAWRVRAVDSGGVVHVDRTFHLECGLQARTVARDALRYAAGVIERFPRCTVTVEPLAPEDMAR